jgi:hypothetical protein
MTAGKMAARAPASGGRYKGKSEMKRKEHAGGRFAI